MIKLFNVLRTLFVVILNTSESIYSSNSQPVGCDLFWGWKDPFTGSPKTIRKHRHSHYDLYQ